MTAQRQWTWPWLIATVTARGLLTVIVCLALWGAAPAAIGWKPTTVSSGSMLPRLQVGDVAVSRPMGDQLPPIGTVLLYDDPDHPGRLRMHRFVAFDDQGRLITRGDANPDNDSTPIEPSAIRGIGTLRIPYVALPVVWAREGAFVPLGLTALVLVGLGLVASQGRRFTFDPPDPDHDAAAGGGSEESVSTPNRPGLGTQRSAVVTAVAAAVSVCLVVPASAAFVATTSTSASLAANPYFSCANAVRPTAAPVPYAPYLWYRMDETSTTTTIATDSSGNNRTGVYSSGGKTRVTKACSRDTGSAFTFNGTTGYLSSPLVTTGSPDTFTVAIWFKTADGYGRGGKLIGYGTARTGASAGYDRHIYMNNAGQIIFGVFPNEFKYIESPDDYNDGAWHHAAGTMSSAGLRLYIDGRLIGSDPNTTSGQVLGNGYWRVAYDNLDTWIDQPTSRFFAGTLDDAVVYPTALTADQITAQYQAGT